MQRTIFRMLIAGVAFFALNGCTSMTPRHFGVRPDDPPFIDKEGENTRANICEEFKHYAMYTQELQEAYYSRSSQNRFWIYASGTTALGTAAATAGVAALAASSSGTLVLLPIAGAFASGVFGVMNNPALADMYTIAATKLETALQHAEAKLRRDPAGNRYRDYDACAEAYDFLREEVAKAKNGLERARTDSASLALQRTAAQLEQFDNVVKNAQAQETARAIKNAEITDINPKVLEASSKEQEITLTLSKGNFSSVGSGEIKVKLGKQLFSAKSIGPGPDASSYLVKFMAPAKAPEEVAEYSPTLLVGSSQTIILANSGVTLTYK